MKTAAGFRMLVVPAKRLELIRLSIDAFLSRNWIAGPPSS
jgi:hypothetical protein